MDVNNNMEMYYIEDIISVNDDLIIYLNKYDPPEYFNEMDKTPIIKIEIHNHNNNLTLEELRTKIDPYEDGVIFEIYNEEELEVIKTIDIGGRTTLIQGTEITKEEIPFTNEQLMIVLRKYILSLENSNTSIFELTSKIESIQRKAKKEIENTDRIMNEFITGHESKKNLLKLRKEIWQTVINKLM